MNITNAQYIQFEETKENMSIKAVIDGVNLCIPISEGNRHYDEIMRQVEAGELTIADAE
tara:strand:+ start:126 stop:302 length:177 start_codon:yes stop_codon:yes gene_type:complete